MKRIAIILVLILAAFSNSCMKDDGNEPTGTGLYKIYRQFRDGEISECSWNGVLVYKAMNVNGVELPSYVLNTNAVVIGVCYGPGSCDTLFSQLQDCEVIYRTSNNIWGLPGVDKYGLAH